MKNTIHSISIIVLTLMASACHQHRSLLNSNNIRAINTELTDSFLQGDLSVIEKYLYHGTEIFIDLDPDPNQGLAQISLKEFRELAKMSLELIDDMEINEEIISIEIDSENDQATLVLKSHASTSIMGMTITENSISTTVFGLINGEIKILKTSDELISMSTQ